MKIHLKQGCLKYCCGIEELGDFDNSFYTPNPILPSGTGLYVATFTQAKNQNTTLYPEAVQKAAYEMLCNKLVLLYQSPVRHNNKSGNKVFIYIFSNGRTT